MENRTTTKIGDFETDDTIPEELNNSYQESIRSAYMFSDEPIKTNSSEDLVSNFKKGTDSVYRQKEKNPFSSLIEIQRHRYLQIPSYYDSVEEFYGTVESIDFDNNIFTASLRRAYDENYSEVIRATFDIDDIQNDSDKELLFIGSQFIWLVGKERKINNVHGQFKPGGITNIARIQFRRTRVLNKKQKKDLEASVHEWQEFFTGL